MEKYEEALEKIIDDFESLKRGRIIEIIPTDRIDRLVCVLRIGDVEERWEVVIGDNTVVFRRGTEEHAYSIGDYLERGEQ